MNEHKKWFKEIGSIIIFFFLSIIISKNSIKAIPLSKIVEKTFYFTILEDFWFTPASAEVSIGYLEEYRNSGNKQFTFSSRTTFYSIDLIGPEADFSYTYIYPYHINNSTQATKKFAWYNQPSLHGMHDIYHSYGNETDVIYKGGSNIDSFTGIVIGAETGHPASAALSNRMRLNTPLQK